VICGLIIAGGLGFVVWEDLRLSWEQYKSHFKVFKWQRFVTSLGLHTKIVLLTTGFLLISGTIIILGLEFNNTQTIGSMPLLDKIVVSFFQSTTLRTAGFSTVDMSALRVPTKLVMSMYMFIGGSPAGTAGGIKTVTFAIILLHIRSLIRGENHVHVMRKTITEPVVKRALTIAFVSFFIALGGLFILSVSESSEFIDLVFEVFSAFATVGLTAAVTPTLTFVGKLIIIILMYIGRIGPITMVLIFAKRYHQMKGKDIEYSQGDVLIG
jgi:trk system potassium uptake protein TrkH